MKNNLVLLLLFLSLLAHTALASTIDPAYHYAWGENVGWIDFSNITVSDTALSGSLYGENIGWIDLSTITNDSEGNLSGYAWGENVGWSDFSQVTIDASGVFTGQIYGENIGWIVFDNENSKVTTDWRPASTRGGTSIGSRPKSRTLPTQTVVTSTSPKVVFTSPTTCTLTLTLRQGSRGEEVKCLQTKLNITRDGIFGPITKATVITFQNANLLVPDGIVGPLTRAKLQ